MKTAAHPLQPEALTAAGLRQLSWSLVLLLWQSEATRTNSGLRSTNGSLFGQQESIIHPCHGVSSLVTGHCSIFLALCSAPQLSLDSKFHTLSQIQSHQTQPFLNGLPSSSSHAWGLTHPLICP